MKVSAPLLQLIRVQQTVRGLPWPTRALYSKLLALYSVLPPERILCTLEGHDDEIKIEI